MALRTISAKFEFNDNNEIIQIILTDWNFKVWTLLRYSSFFGCQEFKCISLQFKNGWDFINQMYGIEEFCAQGGAVIFNNYKVDCYYLNIDSYRQLLPITFLGREI